MTQLEQRVLVLGLTTAPFPVHLPERRASSFRVYTLPQHNNLPDEMQLPILRYAETSVSDPSVARGIAFTA